MAGTFFTLRTSDILLRVKAKPGAREDRVLGVRGDELLVSVRAAPEKGKANTEVIRLLSAFLGVPRSDIVLKAGAGAPRKVFIVSLSARTALERVAAQE